MKSELLKDECSNRGITIITLVITIVLLLIIAGTVSYTGIESIDSVKKTAFISELETIQAKVNVIYEKRKVSNQQVEYYNSIGQDISFIESTRIQEALGEKNTNGFKYFNSNELKKLDLENINQEVLINYDTREVVSLTGFEIEGTKYYKLSDIPNYKGYNVEYTDTNTNAPTFNVSQTKIRESEWRFTVEDIVYNSNVNGGTVSYKLHSDENWILNGDNTNITVYRPGLYDIRFTDKAGNSLIQQQEIIEEE